LAIGHWEFSLRRFGSGLAGGVESWPLLSRMADDPDAEVRRRATDHVLDAGGLGAIRDRGSPDSRPCTHLGRDPGHPLSPIAPMRPPGVE